MQGFGYFMMSLAAAATFGITLLLVFLTLPWTRPVRPTGMGGRLTISVILVLLAFLILIGQGHALIFVIVLTGWLAALAYLTYVRHGILDTRN